MDTLKKLHSLGASPFQPGAAARTSTIEEVELELGFSLPEAMKEVLAEFTVSLCFNVEVRFRPEELSGWEDEDRSIGITLLYGLEEGEWGLIKMNQVYSEQIPATCAVIGDTSGGNQICLERSSGRVLFWDHEAAEQDDVFVVADSYPSFIEKLYVDERPKRSALAGIVEGKSFLDF